MFEIKVMTFSLLVSLSLIPAYLLARIVNK
jgi:hypothetical protein